MATPKRRSLITLSTEHLPTGWVASGAGLMMATAEKLDELLKTSKPMAVRLNSPFSLRDAEVEQIKSLAGELRANSDLTVFVAGGGIALAARALYETLRAPLDEGFPVLFAGADLDSTSLSELVGSIGNRKLSVILACQGPLSAETTTVIALLREAVRKRHGEAEAQRRVAVVADGDCADLIQLAGQEGYRLLAMTPGLGGRCGMFTAAGLMPLALTGVDVLQVAEGARSQVRGMETRSLDENPALAYASARFSAVAQGRKTEILWTEGSRWDALADVWRYIFSSGQLFPVKAALNAERWMLEPWQRNHRDQTFNTALTLELSKSETEVPEVPGWPSGQGVAGQKLAELLPTLRDQALKASAPDGHLAVGLPRLDAFHLGALFAVFQRAAALGELAADSAAFDEHPLSLKQGALR